MKFGLCNLGFPYTFLESTGIIQHCYVFSFLGTYLPLPYLRFKHPVRGVGRTEGRRAVAGAAERAAGKCGVIR